MNEVLSRYLGQAARCPALECERRSSCSKIVDPEWAVLLGWGNPDAPIVFMGLNPHYSADARRIHAVPAGTTLEQHVRDLSLAGFSGVRHFSYHRGILRGLREASETLTEELSEDLDLLAFYTEAALCPTKDGTDLPPDVIDRCLSQNVLPFIREIRAPFIVTLGEEATFHAVRMLVSAAEAARLDNRSIHGRVFEGPGPRFVIGSHHPNNRRSWDRRLVARRLRAASETSGIALY